MFDSSAALPCEKVDRPIRLQEAIDIFPELKQFTMTNIAIERNYAFLKKIPKHFLWSIYKACIWACRRRTQHCLAKPITAQRSMTGRVNLLPTVFARISHTEQSCLCTTEISIQLDCFTEKKKRHSFVFLSCDSGLWFRDDGKTSANDEMILFENILIENVALLWNFMQWKYP